MDELAIIPQNTVHTSPVSNPSPRPPPPNKPFQICNPINTLNISSPYIPLFKYKPTWINLGNINVNVIRTWMVKYWCEGLHLRCFRESRKRHCSLSLFLLYVINVILTIRDCWLLKNLEKRIKSNKSLQIVKSSKRLTVCKLTTNLSFVRIYAQGVLTGFYDILAINHIWYRLGSDNLNRK